MPQCVVAVYAVNRLGAICNLVHPLSTEKEIKDAVRLCDSKVVLTFELNEGFAEGLGAKIIAAKLLYSSRKAPRALL